MERPDPMGWASEENVASTECAKPDPLNPDDDACVSLAKIKLHLIRHSYGAKLVTVASIEALRRWML